MNLNFSGKKNYQEKISSKSKEEKTEEKTIEEIISQETEQNSEFNSKFPTIKHYFTKSSFGHIDIDSEKICDKIRKILGNPNLKIVFAGQPHKKEICFLDSSPSYKKNIHKKNLTILGVDGLLTSHRDVALVIRTADCLPILVAIKDNNNNPIIIGGLHVGRRGLVEGIIENFINFISNEIDQKINLSNAYFLMGPHICGKCHSLEKFNKDTINFMSQLINQMEKDKDTIDLINQLRNKMEEDEKGTIFLIDQLISRLEYFSGKKEDDKVYFDMLFVAKKKLEELGIPSENIYSLGICTYESNDKSNDIFPSFRYNNMNTPPGGDKKSFLSGAIISFSDSQPPSK